MNYGLIGERLGHSYSKVIHEGFGLYEYELKEIPKDELDSFMKAKEFKGINVTIPYKQDVIPYLDEIDEKAKSIGAVNTVVNRDGKLFGYNTDYYGLLNLIKENAFDLSGKKVLILGTGGTSKTAFFVAKDLGAAKIKRVSRKESNEEDIITYDEAVSSYKDCDYIINTTPAGMYPNIDAKAVSLSSFDNIKGVCDVVYNPLRTRLLQEADELGIKNCNGLKMLVYQAAFACEFFVGEKPETQKVDSIFKSLYKESLNPVLIGMPGSGKSTIGEMLSKKLNRELVDTDSIIVECEKREISDIFATDGEKYFRNLEADIVKEVSLRKNVVISTGGGAVLRDESVKNLKANGMLFFLDRKPENLIPTADRPLADKTEKILNLYKERLPIYEKALDYKISTDLLPEASLNEILELLNNK